MTTFESNLKTVIEELQARDVDLQNQIDNEVTSRIAADKDLQDQISKEVLARIEGDKLLQTNIDAEVTARTDADTRLQTSINTETDTRKNVDKDLQDQISKEVLARIEGDKLLQTNIDAEVAARTDADTRLQTSINTETDTRKNVDKELQDQISKEVLARIGGDKLLQTNIDAEVAARTDADTRLQTSINTETDTRKNVDKVLQEQIDALNIAGTVQYFARKTAPDGWLKADGSAISRTQYAKLFTAVGTMFGAGDGSTTFNLPDMRGEFIRGFDDGRGVDIGRTLGSKQASLLETHYHALLNANLNIGGMRGIAPGNGNVYNESTGQVITKAFGDPVTLWANTSSTGGTENRPRNVALLACIKY